jgi:RNA polymerase sigma-70 factor (ECF subfamily)
MAVFARPGAGDLGRGADARLIQQVAGGDASALAAVYDLHAPIVYALALRILGDEGDAEDVVQEVFAQAWRQAGRYDAARGSVAAWLLIMTRTRAIDRLRSRQARPDRGPGVDDTALERYASPAVDPVDEMALEQDVVRVRRALGELPLLQRVAIELAFFEGLTQREIAERLEQPLGTVKTRIRLGLLKLRDALAGAEA